MLGSHRVLESHAPVEGNHGNRLLTGVMCDECHSLLQQFFVSNNATLEFEENLKNCSVRSRWGQNER